MAFDWLPPAEQAVNPANSCFYCLANFFKSSGVLDAGAASFLFLLCPVSSSLSSSSSLPSSSTSSSSLIRDLGWTLQDSGCCYACTPPDWDLRGVVVSNCAFVDDTFCTARTAGAMQTMVDRIAEFSKWKGIHVHIKKSEITAYDYGTDTVLETDGIQYMGHPFAGLAPDQQFKFLGVRLTLTGEWQHEKRYIWKAMMDRLAHHCLRKVYVDQLQAAMAVLLGIVSVFRYSAAQAVVPWTPSELDCITQLWVAGMKTAWKLPSSCATGAVLLSRQNGGQQTLVAHDVYLQAMISVWTANQLHPDDLCILTEQDHCRTLQTYNCTSTSELQYQLQLHPFSHPSSMLARIVAASDDIWLDVHWQDTVKTDAPGPLEFPDGHGLAATIHPLLLHAICTATVRGPGAGAPISCIRDERPKDEETQRQWQESRDIDRCLTWLGLQGIAVVEQLLVALTGHWPAWTVWLVGNRPPRRGYDLLLAALTSATTADQRREWST
eukprot:3712870-Rhodomonas_salina.1